MCPEVIFLHAFFYIVGGSVCYATLMGRNGRLRRWIILWNSSFFISQCIFFPLKSSWVTPLLWYWKSKWHLDGYTTQMGALKWVLHMFPFISVAHHHYATWREWRCLHVTLRGLPPSAVLKKIAGIQIFVDYGISFFYKTSKSLEESADSEWGKLICHCKMILSPRWISAYYC